MLVISGNMIPPGYKIGECSLRLGGHISVTDLRCGKESPSFDEQLAIIAFELKPQMRSSLDDR